MKKLFTFLAAFAMAAGAQAAEMDLLPCYSQEMSWSGASMSGNEATWTDAWGGLAFSLENKDYSAYKYVVVDFAQPTSTKMKIEAYYAEAQSAGSSLEVEAGVKQIKLNLDEVAADDIAKIALISAKAATATITKAVLTDEFTADPVVWEGEMELVNMNTNFTVKANKFSEAKLGDKLTVYFEVGSAANYGTIQLCYGWTKMACDATRTNTKPDGNYAPGTTETAVVLTDAADVAGLIKSGLRVKGKNVILKKIMLTPEGSEPEPPVVEPGPDEPGDDSALWSGTTDTGNWATDVTVGAAKFATVKAGDVLSIYLSVNAGSEYGNIELADEKYTKLPMDGSATELDSYGCVQPDVKMLSYTVGQEDATLLKANGLRVKGANITIEKIVLKSGEALPDDPEPTDVDVVWTGIVNCGQWKQTVSVDADKFAEIQAGDKLSIDLSINAGKGKGTVEVQAQNGTVLAINGKGTNMDGSGNIVRSAKNVEYVLGADDVELLKTHGLLVRGFAITITKVSLLYMETSGISSITGDDNDADAPVEYYTLQGLRVDNPSAGIYIRRQGSKTVKVLVR